MNLHDLKKLGATPNQAAAVTTNHENVLVLAGPGAGKTRTLVWRMQRLIEEGEDPSSIVAVTFTNDAAREIQARLDQAMSKPVRLGFIGTLHAYCLQILQTHGERLGYGRQISVMDDDQAQALMVECATLTGVKKPNGEKLMSLRKTIQRTATARTAEEIAVMGYFRKMREISALDFDAILEETAELLMDIPPLMRIVRHLLVDEYQDSGKLDHEIYRTLPVYHRFFVGDPDQAIYSFRGGRVENIMALACDPAFQTIFLEENFRSGRNICSTAMLLIDRNSNRVAKSTVSMTGTNGAVMKLGPYATDQVEIAEIGREIQMILRDTEALDIAVLARTNHIANEATKTLRAMGIPIREKARRKEPQDWPLAKLVVAALQNPSDTMVGMYLRAKDGPQAAAEFIRKAAIAQVPLVDVITTIPAAASVVSSRDLVDYLVRAGVGVQSCQTLETLWHNMDEPTLDGLAFEISQRKDHQNEEGQGVTVTTMHSAKGREWEVVFLIGLEDEITPGRRNGRDPLSLEEERRLLYVGITRAKETLFLSSAAMRKATWGNQRLEPMMPTRFFSEI